MNIECSEVQIAPWNLVSGATPAEPNANSAILRIGTVRCWWKDEAAR